MNVLKTLKEGLAEVFSGMRECVRLLGGGWKKLLAAVYGKVTGLPAETQPTLFEVLAALHAVISQLPLKKRRAVRIGSAALALVLVVGVGGLAAKGGSSDGGSGSGGGFQFTPHKTYTPEFAKLDCLTCDGDGDCNTCNGYGEVDRYAGGGDTVRSKCSSCYGSGNCRTCGGSGKR